MRQEPIVIDTLEAWAAGYRVFASCRCEHDAEALPTLAALYGPDLPLEAFRAKLCCSRCQSRDIQFSVLPRSTYCPTEFGQG